MFGIEEQTQFYRHFHSKWGEGSYGSIRRPVVRSRVTELVALINAFPGIPLVLAAGWINPAMGTTLLIVQGGLMLGCAWNRIQAQGELDKYLTSHPPII